MKKFDVKLIRDFLAVKGISLGVALVIFLGVAFFNGAYMAFQNLKSSYDYSYQTLHFADFTIRIEGAPKTILSDLMKIKGVEAVSGRFNLDLPLTIPNENKTVLARVISLPAPERAPVNNVKVEKGDYFQNNNERALLVEKSFAEYHGIEPGGKLDIVISGQNIDLNTAGIVTSPEYIFAAKSRQELLISPEVFGVVFIPEGTIEQVTGSELLNEFCFTINSNTDPEAAINAAESVLMNYNIQTVTTRKEQPSNAALSLDLQEFGELAEVFPLLFLIIGALATYILLTRMVQNQRKQIGMLRATGYSSRRVMVHYLEFALIIGIVGAVAGTVAGYFLSGAVTRLYITILGLPYTVTELHWMAAEEGAASGIIVCFLAGLLPARKAAKLRPAEAMRTPPPARGGWSIVERAMPFIRRLPPIWKMAFRNIFRNRNRSLSIVIGVAFGVSLIMVSSAFIDSVDALLDLQFKQIQRYDAEIIFAGPEPSSISNDVGKWNNVTAAEPVLQMPIQLQYSGTSYATILIGLNPANELYGLFNPEGRKVNLPESGILLADSLKSQLNIKTGDKITVTTLSGTSEVSVAGFVKQPMGSPVFMSLGEIRKLTGGQDIINAVMVSTTMSGNALRNQTASLLPGAAVEITSETKQVVIELFNLIKTIMWVMLGFGTALTIVIFFTLITLSIIERRREVASMRTLGETRGTIARMLTIENLWLGILGLVPGLLLGYGLALYFFSIFQTDILNFSMVIMVRTYALTTGLIIVIVLIAQTPGIRNINRLDLARVIKEEVS